LIAKIHTDDCKYLEISSAVYVVFIFNSFYTSYFNACLQYFLSI